MVTTIQKLFSTKYNIAAFHFQILFLCVSVMVQDVHICCVFAASPYCILFLVWTSLTSESFISIIDALIKHLYADTILADHS